MMTPFDTALLTHRPDHLRLPTETERAAARLPRLPRPGFRQFIAQVFAMVPRHGQVDPRSLADTQL